MNDVSLSEDALKNKKKHSGSLQNVMNSYFITLIEFLFLALSTNFVSWNLCRKDAFCPAFCTPLRVCFCFCGLQNTKKFNSRCEPQLNRVLYMDMIQVTKHWETSKYVYQSRICWISIFAFLYIPNDEILEPCHARTSWKNSRGLGKCQIMPHASWEPDLTIHSSPAWFPVRILH